MKKELHEKAKPRGRGADLSRRAAELLRERIRQGGYADKLPGVHALGKELGVHYLTADKAVSLLEQEGLVYRVHRQGTYLTHRQKPRVRNIAAVIGGIGGPIHAELLSGIQKRTYERDHLLFLSGNLDWMEDDTSVRKALDAEQVDGVVFWPGPKVGAYQRARRMLLERGTPCVEVITFNPLEENEFSRIGTDDREGARLAVAHLIGLGHERVVYVDAPPPGVSGPRIHFTRARREGYETAMRAAGLPLLPTLKLPVEGVGGGGYRLGVPTRRTLESFDAFFCFRDQIAYHLLDCLRAHGLPHDGRNVVGYDNLQASAVIGLTSVRQPLLEIGVGAVDLLLREIEQPGAPHETRLLPPVLVARSPAFFSPLTPAQLRKRLVRG